MATLGAFFGAAFTAGFDFVAADDGCLLAICKGFFSDPEYPSDIDELFGLLSTISACRYHANSPSRYGVASTLASNAIWCGPAGDNCVQSSRKRRRAAWWLGSRVLQLGTRG